MTQPDAEQPKRVDYVALSRVLAGHAGPEELDDITASVYAEHQAAKAETADETAPPPSPLELDSEAFWQQCREAEAAIGAKQDELGPGPEFDAWVHELAQLKGQ